MRPRPRSSTYVGVALFPLAVLAVHYARYVLTYGSRTGDELASQGHAYLGALTPLLVVFAAATIGGFLGKLADRLNDGEQERGVRMRRMWLAAFAALIAVYAGQESLEGLFASGHPGGLHGIFGDGGLWAIPAAALYSGGLAIVMRGGHRLAQAAAAARLRAPRLTPPSTPIIALVSRVAVAPLAPLARHAAGRGPPALGLR